MGDGSKQNEGIHLSVYAFTPSDVELLITALSAKGERDIILNALFTLRKEDLEFI